MQKLASIDRIIALSSKRVAVVYEAQRFRKQLPCMFPRVVEPWNKEP